MERRVEELKKSLTDAKVLVYPVQLLDDTSTADAKQLAAKIGEALKTNATPVDTPLKIEITRSSNEMKRLWDLARKFRDFVREQKPDADYTLLAEYLIRPDNKEVWTVHFVICDRAGEWVIVDMQNNHHDDFNTVDPKTTDDCATLIVRRLGGYLK
jgi:hypothetical protein